MAGWTDSRRLLIEEAIQRRDEGVRIPASLRRQIDELHGEADAWNDEKIDPLYNELMALPEDEALSAREPNALSEIRALRPAGPRDLNWKPSDGDLLDRLHGAWTGRCVGCALGKPVEGMGMSVRNGVLAGRARIKSYLQKRGDWPLADYFSERDAGDGEKIGCIPSLREHIAYMEPDDDIHYSLVGLGVMEETGPDFTWSDVAFYWTNHIPFSQICTAETQAILNFWNRSVRWKGQGSIACTPEWTRRNRNPYREWIGAQIRSDGWAFCAAGQPELAAEFAWRDASWTHERNGIYGEMMLAAMQAAAFVESDPHALVAIGLSEIPAECRLAVAVRELLAEIPKHASWESSMAWVERRCADISPQHIWHRMLIPGMSPVHTINNAMICVLSLIYGRMDTQQATAISVMCGLDTDCNGASVGSIVGAAAGRAKFGEHLAARLNDTIKPNIIGFQEVRMQALAERTAAQWRRIGEWKPKRVT